MSGEPERSDSPLHVPSLSGDLKRGSAWMIAMRWVTRLIGFVSTLLLARLLDPSDFGIVAMASIVIGLTDAISALGVDMALIQNTNATKSDFDTAWTVRVIQGVIVGTVLIAAAPLAATYFNEPRVSAVIWTLAIGYIVLSGENIGVVAFRRDLDFARDFRFMIYKRLITFVVVVGAALWLRNYWALVIGILAGNILGCALGYAMHPFRPRFSLAGWTKLWSFSQWMLVRNIGGYALSRCDEFIVGGLAGTRSLGLYSLASEISQLPSTELVAPIDRALFPGFALLQAHPARLRAAYLNTLQLVAVIVIPVGLGLCATAHTTIFVLLGAKWLDMTQIVEVLAVVGIIAALRYTASSILTAIGDTKGVALTLWVQLALFVAIAWPSGVVNGLLGVAYAKLLVSILMMPVGFGWLVARTNIKWLDLLGAVWRPVLSGVMMFGVVRLMPEGLAAPIVTLGVMVATGAIVYAGLLFAFWRVAGCPRGAERLVVDWLLRRIRKA